MKKISIFSCKKIQAILYTIFDVNYADDIIWVSKTI